MPEIGLLKVKVVDGSLRAKFQRAYKRIELNENEMSNKVILPPRLYTLVDEIRLYLPFKARFVGQVFNKRMIRRCFDRWTVSFITAKMGAGKTSFVVNDLIPEAQKTGENVLVFEPRLSIALALKLAIADLYAPDVSTRYKTEGLRKLIRIANVDIVLLQHTVERSVLDYIAANAKSYRYVIFDEAHCLIDDASFIPYSHDAFDFIIRKCKASAHIYLSATMDYAYDPLIEREKASLSCLDYGSRLSPRISVYRFVFDYSYVRPVFFRDRNSVIEFLKQQSFEDKSLVFVDSKKNGIEFTDKLNDWCDGMACYIDADNRMDERRDEFNDIVENEKFPFRVLVCTKLLALGINLVDTSFKNIITFSFDMNDVIQELGRKRVDKTLDEVSFFVYLPSEKEIKSRIGAVNDAFLKYRKQLEMEKTNAPRYREKVPEHFYLESGRNCQYIRPSGFYEEYCKQQIHQLNELLNATETIMLSWIPGHKAPGRLKEDGSIVIQTSDDEFDEVIMEYLNRDLDKVGVLMVQEQIFKLYGIDRRKSQQQSIAHKDLGEILNRKGYQLTNLSSNDKKGFWRIVIK